MSNTRVSGYPIFCNYIIQHNNWKINNKNDEKDSEKQVFFCTAKKWEKKKNLFTFELLCVNMYAVNDGVFRDYGKNLSKKHQFRYLTGFKIAGKYKDAMHPPKIHSYGGYIQNGKKSSAR